MKKTKSQESSEIPEFTGIAQSQFTPAELTVIAQIIDVATRKGIFNAQDLTAVATVYNKVVSYLPKGDKDGQK